jgi:hypothetical protein
MQIKIVKIEVLDGVQYGYWKENRFVFHREDGPAETYDNGDKSWWIHGKLHREDGPAVIWSDGNLGWYLEGEKIKERNFEKALIMYRLSRICK